MTISKKGGASEVLKHLINVFEDAKNLDSSKIEEQLLADEGIQAVLKQTKLVKEAVDDSVYVAASLVAPFTMASQIFGMQDFMVELFDEDNDFSPLLEFATQLSIVYGKLLIDSGANLLCMSDAVASGDLISPVLFEEFSVPYIKKVNNSFGDDIVKMLHICENTTSRLEPVRDLDVDTFSVDSIDIVNALEVAGLDSGFLMAPGCYLAPNTPLENLQAMARVAHDKKA